MVVIEDLIIRILFPNFLILNLELKLNYTIVIDFLLDNHNSRMVFDDIIPNRNTILHSSLNVTIIRRKSHSLPISSIYFAVFIYESED